MNEITLNTSIGTFLGNDHGNVLEFSGVPYARAGRFEYCQLILRWRSESEISNILGVYFKSDTLYINDYPFVREGAATPDQVAAAQAQ